MNAVRGFAVAFVVALVAVAAAGCEGDDPPVTGQQTQAATSTRVTMFVPQVARDAPAGHFLYTVVRGDTLFSIAQRYGTTVAVLVDLNNLDNPNAIEAGQLLIVPERPPTPTPTATPPVTGPSQLIEHGPRNTNYVALTFDMGGRVDPALDIMNFLIQNEVPATIFMTGNSAATPNTEAGRQVLQLVAAHPELFDLGNHSYNHPDFTTLSDAEMRSQLSMTEDAIADVVPVDPRPLFRPPFGAYDQDVLRVVGPAGYPYTIMWDIDTIDWLPVLDNGPTAGEIVSKIANNAQGGSIVLMHLGGYNTFTALPGIIAALEAKGLQPVTLATMLGIP